MPSKNKLLFLVAIVQICFFSGWYFLEHQKLSNPTSKTILVKTLPVDPRDYLSGNYLTLRYEFSNLWSFEGDNKKIREAAGSEIYVVLKQSESYYIPDYISLEKPLVRDNQVAIKGKYLSSFGAIEYGIEKYFINENLKEPKREDKVEVLLVVADDLTAQIKSVMVNGKEFR